MSRTNDGCGCLFPILFWGTLGLIYLCVEYCSNTQSALMSKAREHNDYSFYSQYISKYPDGDYVEEARDSIVSILSKEKNEFSLYSSIRALRNDPVAERLAEMAYYRALKSDVPQISLESYIKELPAEYHWDVQEKLDSIKMAYTKAEARAWATEQLAWAIVSKDENSYNLNKYLELYPNGKHKDIVKKKLIDLEVSRDFAGEHGTMPSMDQTRVGSGRFSTVTVTNQTSYEMTLLYSGESDSERLIISGGGTRSVRLRNGHYRISARVNTSNVIPYVGSETLSGGEYSASYYITSSRY